MPNITGPQEFSACDSLFESIAAGIPQDWNSVLPSGRDCYHIPYLAHTAVLQIPDPDDVHDDGDSVGECFEGKRTEVGEERHQ